MRIAVASGKGGTGKTTVAVALSMAADGPVVYADCDVEEPNGGIFLRPVVTETSDVSVEVPVISEEKCTACGKCARFCRYNALVSLGTVPLVFPELCHSCGGCELVCPEDAISWKRNRVGEISFGTSHGGRISVIQGKLDVGNSLAIPVIRAVKASLTDDVLTVVDSPPGTACPMIESVTGADYILLVTEATPFGLHDLKLAVETVRQLETPFSVVINRFDQGDSGVEDYCDREGIHIMVKIPNRRQMAETYSRGGSLLEGIPELQNTFKEMPGVILSLVEKE